MGLLVRLATAPSPTPPVFEAPLLRAYPPWWQIVLGAVVLGGLIAAAVLLIRHAWGR